MAQSTLIKEDLLKLSVKQLEKFATGVDGADLELVNEVIAEKRARLEQVVDDPNVAKEVGESADLKAAREKVLAEKEAAKIATKEAKDKAFAEKQEALAKAREEKAQKAAEAKAAALEAKQKAILEKEEKQKAILEEKQRKIEERAAEKSAREAARIEAIAELSAAREKRQLESIERAQKSAEKLKSMQFSGKVNKTQMVRECLAKGMGNKQIAEETGFTVKFVCDTVWRIEQMIAQEEYIQKKREEAAAVKAAEQNKAE